MYKLLLCTRYLKTRYIALASVISVTLGVATMIVVNSVMAGFSTEMRERIHGILADMVLEAMSMTGNPDPERQMQIIQEAAGEYITRPVTLIGIEPASKSKVGTLTDHLENYKPETDENGKTIGRAPKSTD